MIGVALIGFVLSCGYVVAAATHPGAEVLAPAGLVLLGIVVALWGAHAGQS